jgi:hypothetical protein
MHLTPCRLSGLSRQFTQNPFAVPNVRRAVLKLNRLGLTADRLYSLKTAAASGKNSMPVAVDSPGGAGAVIARPIVC